MEEVILIKEGNKKLKICLDEYGNECEMIGVSEGKQVTSSEEQIGSRYKWVDVSSKGIKIKVRKV